ncbi:MAG: hypothetical protein Q8M17_04480 [Actinomycetota bacterium]|nr:hypothetical protein [Actinomycetota bacterium]
MTPGPATAPRGARRRWLVAAVAVLAVVVAGTAGIAWGRASAPGPAVVVVPGAVVEVAPEADVVPLGQPWLPGSAQADPGAPGLPAVFTPAPDLPDVRSVASGYRFTRTGLDGPGVARALAMHLGVAGDVATSNAGWTIGSDVRLATLTVLDDPAMTWTMADRRSRESTAPLIAPERARDLAEALLASIGVGADSVEWAVDRYDDRVDVIAWHLVDGERSGLSWTIGVGPGGAIVQATGFAAGLQEVPGYPVVGAATAVRRAALPTWQVLGPVPVTGREGGSTPAPASSLPPSAGGGERPSLQVPMAGIVVTEANLGLGRFWQPDGALLMLPAYRITGDDGSVWTLIAVSGDYVDFVDQDYPQPAGQAP